MLLTIGHFRVLSNSSPSARSCSGSPFSDFHSAMPSPSPMAQDLPPSNEDHISHLEATIDDLKSQGEATKSMLQSILDKLSALAPNLVPSPLLPHLGLQPNTPLSPISTFNTPSASWKRPILKASVPGDFTSDCTKGKAFLSSCQTYIHASVP